MKRTIGSGLIVFMMTIGGVGHSAFAADSGPRLKVYLAGPDVFRPDAVAIGAAKKALAAKYGFEGLFPLDKQVQGATPSLLANNIFEADVATMVDADLVIANMTPFRGPGMDGGTAFEMGYMHASGKPVLGYTEDPREYIARATEFIQKLGKSISTESDGTQRDSDGNAIENFGLTDNLMLAGVVNSNHSAVQSSFEEALKEAKRLRDLGLLVRHSK